jgi:tRNA A-37 threonylcarbamoyl transferase component Bud32
VKLIYWGRFLCQGNSTSFAAFLSSETVVEATIDSSTFQPGCDCPNCVDRWEHVSPNFPPNSTYSYNNDNIFIASLITHGAMCISQVEMFLYYFHDPPHISDMFPRSGPISGGTTVTISGTGFAAPNHKVYCVFGDSAPYAQFFGHLFHPVLIVCTLRLEAKFHDNATVLCSSPALEDVSPGTVVGIRVSNDGKVFSESSLDFFLYADVKLTSIVPLKARASSLVSTVVTLTGQNFDTTAAYGVGFRCKFGDLVASNVTILSATSAKCSTPSGIEGPVSLQLSVSLNNYEWVTCSNCTFSFYEEQDNLPFFLWLAVASLVLLLVVIIIVVRAAKACQSASTSRAGERQPLLSSEASIADENDKQIDLSEIRLGQRIGKGSFGEVYLASWNGTTVAVKKLPASKLTDEFLREFAREARLMRTMRHPNVIQFLGASFDPPDICIVTDYMAQGSLYHLIHDKAVQLSWSRVKRISVDAARGMAYLHNSTPPIIHRDLKSHNLLVDDNWKVKVCDFGLSRRIYEDTQANTLTMCGTPCYTAPEILRNAHYTTKADVYSFAVVLWELVTREEPFSGMPPFQVIFAVGTKGARPEIPSWCPPELAKLIQMCWADDPNQRPSFNQIIEYLESWNV